MAAKEPPKGEPLPRTWLTIAKGPGGTWCVFEAVVEGRTVADVRIVETTYFRDLIEDAARRRLRKLGR